MDVKGTEIMVVHTQGARTVTCILQVLSCVGGRSPSTSELSYSERAEGLHAVEYTSPILCIRQ